MEISLIKGNSIKIKSNKTVIVTDPIFKAEAQAVILTDNASYDLEKVEGKRTVISGPGDYEVGGISIAAKRLKDETIYKVSNDAANILFITSSVVSRVSEVDEYNCVIIKINSKISEDACSVFNSKCYILYGDLSLINLKSGNVEKTVKINLRKAEEISGKIFLLTAENSNT